MTFLKFHTLVPSSLLYISAHHYHNCNLVRFPNSTYERSDSITISQLCKSYILLKNSPLNVNTAKMNYVEFTLNQDGTVTNLSPDLKQSHLIADGSSIKAFLGKNEISFSEENILQQDKIQSINITHKKKGNKKVKSSGSCCSTCNETCVVISATIVATVITLAMLVWLIKYCLKKRTKKNNRSPEAVENVWTTWTLFSIYMFYCNRIFVL